LSGGLSDGIKAGLLSLAGAARRSQPKARFGIELADE